MPFLLLLLFTLSPLLVLGSGGERASERARDREECVNCMREEEEEEEGRSVNAHSSRGREWRSCGYSQGEERGVEWRPCVVPAPLSSSSPGSC
jgi:hypothetical protein